MWSVDIKYPVQLKLSPEVVYDYDLLKFVQLVALLSLKAVVHLNLL